MTSTPQLPVWQVLAADLGKREPPGVRRITGDHFCIEFVRIGAAMTVDRIADAAAGEEVAAVLEGNVRVRSGAEEYESAGARGSSSLPAKAQAGAVKAPALFCTG